MNVLARLLVCFTAAGLALSAGDAAADYRWVNVTGKAAFAPRDGAGALVFKDKIWLLGGWNPPIARPEIQSVPTPKGFERIAQGQRTPRAPPWV